MSAEDETKEATIVPLKTEEELPRIQVLCRSDKTTSLAWGPSRENPMGTTPHEVLGAGVPAHDLCQYSPDGVLLAVGDQTEGITIYDSET